MNCKQVQRQLVSYINGELEEKEEELMVENHSISLDFRAFEIKTLRLKLAQRKEKTMEKQELLTEGKFFHGFFIRKISLIVVIAGKDIRNFTDRNISERINVVYDVFHPDVLISVYDKVDHRFVAV